MDSNNHPDDLLTPLEVAAILRCHTRTLSRYRQSGKLAYERHSKRSYRYRRGDVEAFRDNCHMDPGLAK